jgi:MoaA/NifB/PqqE/SkfB family radical SAM enzyme
LRTLHDRGVRILIIEGGEPFLWRDGEYDLQSVVAQARKLFFSVGVTTNGTFPIEIDSDIVWVSIDGLQETHDRLRGKSFQRIVANIEATSHPRVYAHITVNSLNWQEIPQLVEYLSLKVEGITVQFYYPYQEIEEELYLPSDQRRQVLDSLIELKGQGFPLANSYACLEAVRVLCPHRDLPGLWLENGSDDDRAQDILCPLGFESSDQISSAFGAPVDAQLHNVARFRNANMLGAFVPPPDPGPDQSAQKRTRSKERRADG